MRCSWRISSLYLTAVKLNGTCTRSIVQSFEIVDHIMTLPLPKLSTTWTQEEEKRSFRRQYTRMLPSHFCSRKRDSSLNQILRQFRNVQPLNLFHQRSLLRLCNDVNIAPKYGLLGLMSCCRSRCGLFVNWFLAIQVFRLQWLMRQRFDSVDERSECTDLAQA
jgi:hypothetical protein